MTVTSTTASSSYLDSLRTNSTTATAATTAGSSTIDQAGFLKLLTAQMTNQDPTAPMDSNTMVQQLSEMSTVSGITEMNSSMKSLVSELTSNRIGDAASWIGKAALLSSSTAQPLTNGGYAGEITLPVAATNVVVGLYYSAQWQSGKASMSISGGETALTRLKKIYGLGLVLADTHPLGLQYGPDFGHLADMPSIEGGQPVDQDTVWPEYDFQAMEFDGGWITDARLCLQAASPRPCTITAAVPQYEMRTGG